MHNLNTDLITAQSLEIHSKSRNSQPRVLQQKSEYIESKPLVDPKDFFLYIILTLFCVI